MSRRAFLTAGARAGAATVALGGVGAAAAAAAPTNDVDAIVLQLAAAAAVWPFEAETGEGGPIEARLTAPHVVAAWARCSSVRTAQAERAAQRLTDAGLGGLGTQSLLVRLSTIVGEADAGQLDDLNALVGVAAATLADAIDPDGEIGPGIWLGTLAIMHENGDRPVVEAAP
ncbi:hypothetical protein Q5424_25255 [Conexibacter sp. JD483]|uniref:hypothetical protein n=1 Tax=unclassified Conexibacter TaxID=2627773 RepID=UPI0027193BE5|nr:MULTISPECIES: hypothetical protein [unclassified Conexibacter]MDO8187554.1 hypothetical protein [Conexibacter sp. CPCC 205706]MDO8198920.1 hypothetical protein [Conexibacter sp. CPCC 205762]MDR9372430.1 hypothetical protein [Conexibacter sp. JD483]